jgi:AraC family transcriptional regulator, transcriptional activator FtrA
MKVAAVIDQGALTFDFAIPCEIFGLDRSDIVDPWYEFLVVAAGRRRVRTQTGFVIEAPHGLEALPQADTILVPGWSDPEDEPSDALKQALRDGHERGARIVSLCTGAFVLGAAGLLDGRRATTHWLYAERLQRRCPRAVIEPGVLYVADDRVMTSAGTAAGIDLCLHLVASDHGVEVAAAVARRLVMPLHRAGGQAQYVDEPIASSSSNGLGALLDWGRANLGAGVAVDDLARRGAMSTRTLTRKFRATLAMAPGEWLQRERLRLAQRLLESTDDPIATVARRAGYDSAATMRARFAARLQTSPRAYRQTFRSTERRPNEREARADLSRHG